MTTVLVIIIAGLVVATLCFWWKGAEDQHSLWEIRAKYWNATKHVEDLAQRLEAATDRIAELQAIKPEVPKPQQFEFQVFHETLMPQKFIAEQDIIHNDGTLELSLIQRKDDALPPTVAVFATGKWIAYQCRKVNEDTQ